MRTSVRRAGALAALVCTAAAGEADAASEPPHPAMPLPAGIAETAADAAEAAGHEAGRHGVGESAAGSLEEGSRLLRSLSERAAKADAAAPPAASWDPSSGVAAEPGDRVVFGCPRALLTAMLAEAAETGDAVSALAIERETLALCHERQEIVTGIVTLEGELRALLAEADEAAAPAAVAEAPAKNPQYN